MGLSTKAPEVEIMSADHQANSAIMFLNNYFELDGTPNFSFSDPGKSFSSKAIAEVIKTAGEGHAPEGALKWLESHPVKIEVILDEIN